MNSQRWPPAEISGSRSTTTFLFKCRRTEKLRREAKPTARSASRCGSASIGCIRSRRSRPDLSTTGSCASRRIFFSSSAPHLVAFALRPGRPARTGAHGSFASARRARRQPRLSLLADTGHPGCQRAVDLTLSILPGYGERSVTFYGNGATARCDFARDIYYRDEPSGYGLVADNLLTTLRVAGAIAVASVANCFKATLNTLRKSPAANPYGECIERSIRAFYREGRTRRPPERRLRRGGGRDLCGDRRATGIRARRECARRARSQALRCARRRCS